MDLTHIVEECQLLNLDEVFDEDVESGLSNLR
jgi:hypothetical protein